MSETVDPDHMGQNYLSGLGQTASVASVPHESKVTASELLQKTEAITEATMQSYRPTEATEAVSLKKVSVNILVSELQKRFSEMSPELKQLLINRWR